MGDLKGAPWGCPSLTHPRWGERLASGALMHFFQPLGADPSPWLSLQKKGLIQALGENHNLLLT